MRMNCKRASAIMFSLLIATVISIAVFADPVSAVENEGAKVDKVPQTFSLGASGAGDREDGRGVHGDPTTFEKNFCLSVDQKEYAISEIDRVVSRLIKPGMSDLEKYFTLAVWEYKHVKYDNSFWSGRYNFEYYSHQWDAYGALKEKSVCAGMAILYANLCHAADLPCKFVRTDPKLLDHTVNYIPDINGHAYYVDVTENVFVMSENSADSFGGTIDKDFAGITNPCTDETFDYWVKNDSTYAEEEESLHSTLIKEDCCSRTYAEWFEEFALHENTDKDFRTPYVEKGSGDGTYHASYQNFQKYPAQSYENLATREATGIWFLDDFFEDPKAIEQKILGRELDEQLVHISGVKDSYDSEDVMTLEEEVTDDIMVRYFPSLSGNQIVPWEDDLKTNMDYKIEYESYDDETGEAIFTIEGNDEYAGAYEGSSQFRVKWTPKYEIKNARILAGVYYSDITGELEPEVVYEGEPLEKDKDYTWEKVNPEDTFDKPGDYEVRLIGKGDYKGKAVKTFHIVRDEEDAEQAVEDAKAELAAAQEEIGALGEDATPAQITAALKKLVSAQQALNDAHEALARSRDIISKEKQTELEEQIAKLNEQIKRMNDKIDELNGKIADAQVIDISRYPFAITLPNKYYQYTGKAIEPEVEVVGLSAENYVVSYSDNTNIGIATVTVTATGENYTGTIDTFFEITKRVNTLAVKAKTAKVKYKKLKKKAQTLKVGKVIKTTKKGQGTITYAKASGSKKIKINKKTGKVTVKKGLKKGTYKVKVKVEAAGNATYDQATKTVTFKIKIK